MNSFSKGIITDITTKLQPKDSYRFALNAVLESSEGNYGSIISELGTSLSTEIDGNIIGHCQLDDDTIALFIVNDSSEIGIYNPISNSYTTLIKEDCLNFQTSNPIHCLFRVREGCKKALYFTDRLNTYRTITIEDISSYYVDGVFDCERISLNPQYDIPTLEIDTVLDQGGRLKVGSYQFAIRYLDADLNPTNWFYITSPVSIYDEPTTSSFFQIDGAIPIFDNAEAEEGAVPATSKSIRLAISGLDDSFSYYQIAALHSTSTTGRVSETWILEENYITASSTFYTYGGANTSLGHFQGDLADITVDNAVIDVVQHHAQKDNYLILGGLSTKEYEFSRFQSAANNISIKWATKQVPFYDQTQEGSAKNPLTQYGHRSLMGDEVYAIGIQWLIKNKYYTNTFHIPGRIKNTTDAQLVSSSKNTAHLPTADNYERWQVQNTSSVLGQMGYYESSQDYPDIRDCDNNRVFPEGKIRHHKMPGRDLIPIYDEDGINILGITASNVVLPHEDVTGYRIMISIRDETNSTSVESALLTRAFLNPGTTAGSTDDQYEQPFFWGDTQWEPRTDTQASMLFANSYYVNNNPSNFSYLKMNYNIETSSDNRIQFEGVSYDRAGGGNIGIVTKLTEVLGNQSASTILNRDVSTSITVSPRTEQAIIGSFDTPIFNQSYSNNQHFIWMTDTLDEAGYKIVTKKNYIANLYSNLAAIRYRPFDHNVSTGTSVTHYNGDTYISELKVADIWKKDDSVGRTTINTHYLNKVWLESPINFDMVYEGTDICNSRYVQGTTFGDYFIYKVAEEQDNGEFAERTYYCPEFYGYNKDFSKLNLEDVSFGLPLNFDYCSECVDEYPYRIRYSKQSYQEEISDNYRVFLENDYRDLDGSTGVINSLIIDKDELYVFTTKAPWFVPTRPQQVVTNESIAYLGTGERLAIPPKKMASSYYGGCLDTKSIVSTEFGTVFISEREGKVFHLASGLDEISGAGNRNWFENNLPLNLSLQYRSQLGIEYPLRDGVTHANGIGFIAIYDPRHRRIIIHKKDYLPLYPLSTDGQYNTIRYYAPDKNFYFTDGGEDRVISVDDPAFFENKSWTYSYSLPHKAWVSFHSYLPSYMFNDEDNFYSVNDSIWSHNTGNYQTYYDTKYDFIVDSVINPNPQVSSVFQSLELVANFEEGQSLVDHAFDRALFYSDKQSSGLQDLIYKDETNPFANEGVLIQKVDDEYQISNIRNNVVNPGPIFSTSWTDLQDDYYIDKVPNPGVTDPSKSLFDQDRFRGEWMGVRLYSNSAQNTKITMELINTNTKYSYR